MDESLLAFALSLKDVPKPVVELGCELIKNLLGYPAQAAGLLLGDTIYEKVCFRRINMAARVADKLKQENIAPRILPEGFLLTYFDGVGYSNDDEDIEKMWENLLTSAIEDDANVQAAFVHVLRNLGPSAALRLRELASSDAPQLLGYNDHSPEISILLMLGLAERIYIERVPRFTPMTPANSRPRQNILNQQITLSPFAAYFLQAVERKTK